MRLNRGLSLLALTVLVNSVGMAAPETGSVRRPTDAVGVGHVKTSAEMTRFLEGLKPEERKRLGEALGKGLEGDSGVDNATRKAYKEAAEKYEKATGSAKVEAEREYHAAMHRALETQAFIAKDGKIMDATEAGKVLKSLDLSALKLNDAATLARVDFGQKLLTAFGKAHPDEIAAFHDMAREQIENLESSPTGAKTPRAELDVQESLVFLANKMKEIREANAVEGVGEAAGQRGKMAEAEKGPTAKLVAEVMDATSAAGKSGAQAKAVAEGVINLLTGKDPVTRQDALAGLKLVNDTFANDIRKSLDSVSKGGRIDALEELKGISADKTKVEEALKGLSLVKADGSPRALSDVLVEVRERLKAKGLKEAEINEVIEALRTRAGKKIIELIAKNENLDKAGKEELLCGVPGVNGQPGKPPCMLLPNAASFLASKGVLQAAGINADQCLKTRTSTLNANAQAHGSVPATGFKAVAPGTHTGGTPPSDF